MKKRRLALFFAVIPVIFLGLIILPTSGEAEIRLTPRKITFTPNQAGSYRGEFEITNDSDGAVKLSISTSDWKMSKTGKVQLTPVGSAGDNSLGKWISGYPDGVEIPPDNSKKITFRVKVPTDRWKPRWGAFLIRPLQEETETKEGLQLGVKVQYAVTLYQKIAGETKKRGNIDRLKLVSGKNRETSVEIHFTNFSPTFLRPKGTLIVRTVRGETALKKRIEEFLVLPNHTRHILKPLNNLNPGQYLATVVLDYGGKERVGARIAFNRN